MIAFYAVSTANPPTFRDFEKNHDFSKTLRRNFFPLSLGKANLSFPVYGQVDNF